MLAALNGYKTYIVAGVTIVFAVVSYWGGAMDAQTMELTILGALGLGGLRHGISTGT